MNILVICKRYYTNKDLIEDKFGRLFHFPRYWSMLGNKVTVIALDYKSSKFQTKQIDGIKFYVVPFPALLLNTAIRIYKIASSQNPTVIIASGDSYIGYFSMLLAKRLKTKFVFDLYHDYRDFGSNRIPGMKFLFNLATQKAHLIACDSSILSDRMKELNNNTVVIPQGVDTNLFKPLDIKHSRQKLSIDIDGIYLGYTGSFDQRFDYECMIKAIEKLREKLDIKLLLAGPNIEKFNFNKPYIHYLGVRPQSEISMIISACNVMIIPYKDIPLSDTCNPCKLTEYIACQRPIVVSGISDMIEYFDNPARSVYKPSDHDDLYSKLLRQIESPIVQNLTGNMLWSDIAEKYLHYLQKIIR